MDAIPAKLIGSQKTRHHAKNLTVTLIDPAGYFLVEGGQAPHQVTVTAKYDLENGNIPVFENYQCADCLHNPYSHMIAVMMLLEPQLFKMNKKNDPNE